MRRPSYRSSARRGQDGAAWTRARPGMAIARGLLSWGILISAVSGIVVARTQIAQAGRAPLSLLSVQLSASDAQGWTSIPAYKNTVPVLVYHGIGGRANYLTVSRALFAQQMTALKLAGFHTLTMQQYVSFVHGNTAQLPSKPILLTFDDGRLDAYRAANAILKADGFHAVELVVPGWVTANPNFSLSWSEIEQMASSGTWDVEEHFGFGPEGVPINAAGKLGGRFADLEYIRGSGKHGHLETFAQFQAAFMQNMLWGGQQMQEHIPGYQPLGMAIPRSDYGQTYTNDRQIPPYVIKWLDQHFPVVFGGDYLDTTAGSPFQFEGRFGRVAPQISYRITMGPTEILPVLRCRLLDYIKDTPIWYEYSCLRLAKTKTSTAEDDSYVETPNPTPMFSLAILATRRRLESDL